MDLKSHKTLSEKIADKLIYEIIKGHYAPGSRLPTERDMAESFHVTRHVIREALKRVDTLGLIRIRQGSGAIIQNYMDTGGLEIIDFLIVDDRGNFNLDFLKEALDFHELVSLNTIKLAIERMTDEEFDELKSMVAELSEKCRGKKLTDDILLRLSVKIVQLSKNQYNRLLFNTLTRFTNFFPQLFTLPEIITDEFAEDLSTFFTSIVKARKKKNPRTAEKTVSELFRKYKGNLIGHIESNLKG